METPIIRYNLKDRGRQHTGQKRNFNIKAIADEINSPATQEMVATSGMYGYYGHLPRIRFGMNPGEGGFDNGKYVPVEPAFVTTHLRADYDGNVEHRARFFDNESGQKAQKLWNSKFGGFSSAIDEGKPAFYGFDFVYAPNFLGNSFRGAALDSVEIAESEVTYDSVYAAERAEYAAGDLIAGILDSVASERIAANAVIERLTLENEAFLSALAAHGQDAGAVLDSMGAIRPMILSTDSAVRFEQDRRFFLDSALPTLQPLPKASDDEPKDYATERLLRQYGRSGR